MAELLEAPAHSWPGVMEAPWQPAAHSQQQVWYYVCVSICTTFAGIFLILRLYTKLRFIHSLDLPDCMYCPQAHNLSLICTQV